MIADVNAHYLQSLYIFQSTCYLRCNRNFIKSIEIPPGATTSHVASLVIETCKKCCIGHPQMSDIEELFLQAERSARARAENKYKNDGNQKLLGARNNEANLNLPWEYCQKLTSADICYEAILVGKMPFYLYQKAEVFDLKHLIAGFGKEYRPPDSSRYLNLPYSFSSREEIEEYFIRASCETLDTLYAKVETQVRRYVVADDNQIRLIAADIIFTYFQDRLGMTHYLFFYGDNGTGKTVRNRLLQQLAYRNLNVTSLTYANIYSFLGTLEEGAGTLSEDEVEGLEFNQTKMAIYKAGYVKGQKVTRLDISRGREQNGYFTYCFKSFSGEHLPDAIRAKGFIDRLVPLHCTAGFPDYDIEEVLADAGHEEYATLAKELADLRKLLLVYRILNFGRPIPAIRSEGISGREKQLFGSLIRLFQDTKTIQILMPTISHFLHERQKSKQNSLTTELFRIIMKLTSRNLRVSSKTIWQALQETVPGNTIPDRPQSYRTYQYGDISWKMLSNILQDSFSARQVYINDESNGTGGRGYEFDNEKLAQLAVHYDRDIDCEARVDKAETLGTLETLTAEAIPKEELNGLDDYTLEDAMSSEKITTMATEPTKDGVAATTKPIIAPFESVVSVVSVARVSICRAKCPYCHRDFPTEVEVVGHSMKDHPGSQLVVDLLSGRLLAI